MAGPLRGGGGIKGQAIKEKNNFFWNFFFQRSKISTAIRLEGAGGLCLIMARPLRQKNFFCKQLLCLLESAKGTI